MLTLRIVIAVLALEGLASAQGARGASSRPRPLPPSVPRPGYAYPHVRPDPAYYMGHVVKDTDKPKERLAYEARKLRLLDTYTSVIFEIRSAALRLPARERGRRALLTSVRTAFGDRTAARAKLQSLVGTPNERWEKVKPSVDRAFDDLRGSIGRAQVLLARHAPLRDVHVANVHEQVVPYADAVRVR